MRANYIQRTIDSLKPSEKKAMDELYFARWDEELCQAQFNWIKLGACAWSMIGKSKEDIADWLGAFKRLYQTNSRFTTQEELTEFLDKKMDEIFGKGGFPEEFMQSFKKIGRN